MSFESYNDLYLQGTGLIAKNMLLGGNPNSDQITHKQKDELLEGIRLLEEAEKVYIADLGKIPNFPIYWGLGKACQSLRQHDLSYQYFLKAFESQKTHNEDYHADVLRELSLEALYTNHIKECLYYSQMAVEFAPEDLTLKANLALVLMMNGRLEDAKKAIKEAVTKNCPNVEISINMQKVIALVADGKHPAPKSIEDLEVLFETNK